MKPEKTELLDRSLSEADNSESVSWTSHCDIDYTDDDIKWLL